MRPPPWRAGRCGLAFVRCCDCCDDRESEPGAAAFAGTRLVDAKERVEEMRNRSGRNKFAAVGDLQQRVVIGLGQLDADEAAGVVVVKGVLGEVRDQALQELAIPVAGC
jgi:hypothetical protein